MQMRDYEKNLGHKERKGESERRREKLLEQRNFVFWEKWDWWEGIFLTVMKKTKGGLGTKII